MWEISLTCHMLFHVWSFSYTLHDILWEEFLLHGRCCFMWRVSLTCPMLFYMGSFADVSHAISCGKFLLHAPCCFVLRGWVGWGGPLMHPILFYVGFTHTHRPYYFMWWVSHTCPMLFYVGSFLHSPCCFMWGVSYTTNAVLCGEFLTLPMLFYVGCFLHSPCCFMWEVSYTPHAVLCGEFLISLGGLSSEDWETNARTRHVRQSLMKQVSCQYVWFALILVRSSASSGNCGFSVGICCGKTQLVWICLSTDGLDLCLYTSVFEFRFTSFVLFSFCVSFTFTSHGPVLRTVALIMVLCFHTHLDPVENDDISSNSWLLCSAILCSTHTHCI